MNDSLLVAEATLVAATLLLSSDAHIKDIDYARLKLVLDAADVSTPLIGDRASVLSLRIELASDVWRHKTFPKIRLQEKWLEQFGSRLNGRRFEPSESSWLAENAAY